MAGKGLGYKGALVELRADWPEFCTENGFRGHTSIHPCPFCSCSLEDMYSFEDCNSCEAPWDIRTPQSYEVEIAKHEITFEIQSLQERDDITNELYFDKRQVGNGLCLRKPVKIKRVEGPSIELKIGDRIESTYELQDTYQIFDISTFPFKVTFWRPKETHDTFCQKHMLLTRRVPASSVRARW